MAFWIAIAVLTAAATIALLAPLYRTRVATVDKAAAMAIYRDQLGEIDRDIARGVLPESEAKAARAEIGRRLLSAEAAPAEPVAISPTRRRTATIAALVAVPAISLGAYLWLGSPDDPDLPVAHRLDAPNPDDLPALAVLVAGALAADQNDVQLWQASLQLNMQLGDPVTAGEAYVNLVRLQGSAADPTGDLGVEIGVAIANAAGEISDSAVQVFTAAAAAAPDSPNPRLYLAMAMTQGGDHDGAIAAWQALLAQEPAGGAPWGDFARAELAALEGGAPDEAASIAELSPDQQQAAINTMVDRLAARLADNPADPDGWAQLIRSYIVLGRTDEARAAVDSARTALAGNDAALAQINEAAQPLEQTP